MKKALYGLMIAGAISGTALAGGPDVPMGPSFRPFVGVNYSYLSLDNIAGGALTGNADSFNGIGFEAGVKYGHYFGLVWGWNHYFSENNAAAVRKSPETFYFDMRGYWPLMAQFNLIASVGAGLMDIGSGAADMGNAEPGADQVNLRLGVGADYWFTHNWGLQAMFHYSPSHNPGTADFNSFWTITAGIYYMFS